VTALGAFIVGTFLGFICGVALTFYGLDQRLLEQSVRGLEGLTPDGEDA